MFVKYKLLFSLGFLLLLFNIININNNKLILNSNIYMNGNSNNIITFRDSNDNILMTRDVISRAEVSFNSKTNSYEVLLTIKDKDKFYNVTDRVSKSNSPYIAIWYNFDDDKDSYYKYDDNGNIIDTEKCGNLNNSHCLSFVRVSQAFASDVVIQGKFTKEEAVNLVNKINNGSPSKFYFILKSSIDIIKSSSSKIFYKH